jgi:hypothetical protein
MTTLYRSHNISEQNAYNSCKEIFSKLTRPYPEYKIYSESNGRVVYAQYKCFDFQRRKKYREGYKSPLYYTSYKIEKIFYDNRYDRPRYFESEDQYLERTQKSWFAD